MKKACCKIVIFSKKDTLSVTLHVPALPLGELLNEVRLRGFCADFLFCNGL